MANFDVQILDLINADYSDQTAMDGWATDAVKEITNILPSDNSGGKRLPCRQVPISYADSANDSTSLHYASVTDPVYFISSSNDAVILSVLPTPTADQTAIVYHLGYTSVNVSEVSTIANFPDEAEYLVVLYTAIKVAESLLSSEEDIELYTPIIATLKQDYNKGITMLSNQGIPQAQERAK